MSRSRNVTLSTPAKLASKPTERISLVDNQNPDVVGFLRAVLLGVHHKAKNISQFLVGKEYDKLVREEAFRMADFFEGEAARLRGILKSTSRPREPQVAPGAVLDPIPQPGQCYDCRKQTPMYMARNDVWGEAWPGYLKLRTQLILQNQGVRVHLLLCFGCLSKRLGRALTIDDFDLDIICNQGIRLGFELGQHYEMGHRQGVGVVCGSGITSGTLDSSGADTERAVEAT